MRTPGLHLGLGLSGRPIRRRGCAPRRCDRYGAGIGYGGTTAGSTGCRGGAAPAGITLSTAGHPFVEALPIPLHPPDSLPDRHLSIFPNQSMTSTAPRWCTQSRRGPATAGLSGGLIAVTPMLESRDCGEFMLACAAIEGYCDDTMTGRMTRAKVGRALARVAIVLS